MLLSHSLNEHLLGCLVTDPAQSALICASNSAAQFVRRVEKVRVQEWQSSSTSLEESACSESFVNKSLAASGNSPSKVSFLRKKLSIKLPFSFFHGGSGIAASWTKARLCNLRVLWCARCEPNLQTALRERLYVQPIWPLLLMWLAWIEVWAPQFERH